MSARARVTPKWSGTVGADGVLRLDANGLFKSWLGKALKNQPVEVIVRKMGRPKSHSALGYLFGVIYPIAGEEFCDTDYDVEALHDAFMRKLRGLKPEPNPLQMRETLRDKDAEYLTDYINDLRHVLLTDYGMTTPDASKVDVPTPRKTVA